MIVGRMLSLTVPFLVSSVAGIIFPSYLGILLCGSS